MCQLKQYNNAVIQKPERSHCDTHTCTTRNEGWGEDDLYDDAVMPSPPTWAGMQHFSLPMQDELSQDYIASNDHIGVVIKR